MLPSSVPALRARGCSDQELQLALPASPQRPRGIGRTPDSWHGTVVTNSLGVQRQIAGGAGDGFGRAAESRGLLWRHPADASLECMHLPPPWVRLPLDEVQHCGSRPAAHSRPGVDRNRSAVFECWARSCCSCRGDQKDPSGRHSSRRHAVRVRDQQETRCPPLGSERRSSGAGRARDTGSDIRSSPYLKRCRVWYVRLSHSFTIMQLRKHLVEIMLNHRR